MHLDLSWAHFLHPYLTKMEWWMRQISLSSKMPYGKPLETIQQMFPMVPIVLDGGTLLQRIPWIKRQTFEIIWEIFTRYIIMHYETNVMIVFDGYHGPSTKDTAHLRLVKVSLKNKLAVTKEVFLLNQHKQGFLNILWQRTYQWRYRGETCNWRLRYVGGPNSLGDKCYCNWEWHRPFDSVASPQIGEFKSIFLWGQEKSNIKFKPTTETFSIQKRS